MKSPWLLRILALVGFVIATYLFVQKATGKIDSIVGCGAESGCANVLGSRWSQFFGIPVSALAALTYLALLAATWKPSRPLYAAFAVMLLGAAGWFAAILIVELKAFCPWCTAMHGIGVLAAVVMIISLKRVGPAPQSAMKFAPVAGVLGLLVLMLGQLFGPVPDTHLETQAELVGGGEDADEKSGKGRRVTLPGGAMSYHTGEMPHLGPADAPHVLVKYFDYTCGSCKDMHEDLEHVAEQYPGQICMIMLPVPLSRDCNPHFPTPLANHEHACELARLGLAAWRAKPEAFPEVHEQLFTRPILEPEIAEIAVSQIVGEEALAAALEDPWIEETLNADIEAFRQLISKTIKMPKVVVVDTGVILHGLTRSAEVLSDALAKQFKLPVAGSE